MFIHPFTFSLYMFSELVVALWEMAVVRHVP